MAKHIILIHGRNTKPAQAPYQDLQKVSLLQGLNRIDSTKAKLIETGDVKLTFAYYGDVNNDILGGDKLSANDPDNGNSACLPNLGYKEAIERLAQMPNFSKQAYSKIIRKYKDSRFLDDALRMVSTIASLVSARTLNEAVIKKGTRDMGLYLMTHTTGSKIRTRLQTPLTQAFKDQDDICLICHSMGAIVAYDVLWKFSHMSEYAHVRAYDPMVNLWLTIGSPLGEAGVRENLFDRKERGEDKHPKGIIRDWVNISAKDDFIAHDATAADDFKAMKSDFHGNVAIKDIYRGVYNCYVQDGKSDPHKIFGYLAHPKTAQQICDWIDR